MLRRKVDTLSFVMDSTVAKCSISTGDTEEETDTSYSLH